MVEPNPDDITGRIMRLEIQKLPNIGRDTWINRKYIGMMLGIILAFILLSSATSAYWSGASFFIVSKAGNDVKQIQSTLEPLEALYFTVINMTTVGFGDIVPANDGARAIAIFNSIFGVITFAGLVSVLAVALTPKESPPAGGATETFVLTADPKPALPTTRTRRNRWTLPLRAMIRDARRSIDRARPYDWHDWNRARRTDAEEGNEAKWQAAHIDMLRRTILDIEARLRHIDAMVDFYDAEE